MPSFKSKAIPSCSFTHSTPRRSINSKAEGTIPALKMADTAAAAAPEPNDAKNGGSTVGRRNKFDHNFGDHAQSAFGADHQLC